MKIERYRVRDRTRRFVFLGCTGLVSAGCRGAIRDSRQALLHNILQYSGAGGGESYVRVAQ